MKGLPRHEHYKDSGVSWIEEIPFSWRTERAKWLFQRMERPIRPEDEVVTAFRNGQVTLRKNRREEGFTNALQEHGYQGIRKGDLVIHAMDAFAGAIGVSDSDGKSTPVYSACIPRGKYYVNNYYYAYLLRYMSQSGFIQALAKGIRERSTDFRFNDFANLWLPIPSREEQDKIVSFLDQKTTEIDGAINKKQRLIELLQEQKAILINQAVTKGLNPNVPMRDSGVEWIGKIPAHWSAKKLKIIVQFIDGDRGPNYPGEGDYVMVGIPFLSSKNIVENKLRLDKVSFISGKKFRSLGRGKLQAGDLIITVRGTIGSIAVFNGEEYETGFINAQMMIIRPGRAVTSEFLHYLAQSDLWRKQLSFYSYGSAQQQLSGQILRNIYLAIPDVRDQEEIVCYLQHELTKVDEAIHSTLGGISLLQEYKSLLITNAVTGKIKV